MSTTLLDGLVHWYDLATDAVDQHAGADATNVGGVTFDGDAAAFDNTAKWLELPIATMPPTFTFAIYARYDPAASGYKFPAHKGYAAAEPEWYLMFVAGPENAQFGVNRSTGGSAGSNVGGIPQPPDWILFVAEYTADTIWLWASAGTEFGPNAFGPRALGTLPILLGHAPGYNFHGGLKRYALWDRQLTADERTALTAAPRYADLVPALPAIDLSLTVTLASCTLQATVTIDNDLRVTVTLAPCTLQAVVTTDTANDLRLTVTLAACTVVAQITGAYATDVDEALVRRLADDAQLAQLMPGGVWFEVPPIGQQRYVLVSLFHHDDAYVFNDTAWETYTYLVKAVALDPSGRRVRDAALRIHRLLQDARFDVPGYHLMNCQRTQYVRDSEVDALQDLRWTHGGGFYDLMVQPK